ncbi:hypothetical protein N7449_008111 [Penicillium cf. viridicatum]|uniref:Uncharacterized protein n=1 Tax=Penicillium cf. viridicatum TaxID=2972119 RepID=A0A9W9MEU1_9EURO|nr:hypothetical protein N7449_008111 [Penicillium cf. viridicatum]
MLSGSYGMKDPQWRDIIQKCWTCQYSRASDILKDIPSVPCFRQILARIQSNFRNGKSRPMHVQNDQENV